MDTYVLILLAYVGANNAQLTPIRLPQRYESEANCMAAGQSMKYVSKRNAEDVRIGFICIKSGTAEDDDD